MATHMYSNVEILYDAGSSKLALRADCVHVSSLKLATEEVFTPWKLANLQMRAFFLRH